MRKRCKKCFTINFSETTKCEKCKSTSFFDDVFDGLKSIPTRRPFGKKEDITKFYFCSRCKKKFILNKEQEKEADKDTFAGFLCLTCKKSIKENLN